MRNAAFLLALLASIAAGSPIAGSSENVQRSALSVTNIQTGDIAVPADDTTPDSKVRRGLTVSNIQTTDAAAPADDDNSNDKRDADDSSDSDEMDYEPGNLVARLEKRKSDSVNCGSGGGVWTPLAWATTTGKSGFNDAISAFCNEVEGIVVPYKKSTTAQISGLTTTTGAVGKGIMIAGISNDKIKEGYQITITECNYALAQLTNTAHGHKCYGTNNKDTKGGKYNAVNIGSLYAYVKNS